MMKLRVGNYLFDFSTGAGAIEHRTGVVALVARHKGVAEVEIVDASASDDMNEAAQQFVEAARRQHGRPGVIVSFLTAAADRREANGVADALLRRRWLHAEPVYHDSARTV